MFDICLVIDLIGLLSLTQHLPLLEIKVEGSYKRILETV